MSIYTSMTYEQPGSCKIRGPEMSQKSPVFKDRNHISTLYFEEDAYFPINHIKERFFLSIIPLWLKKHLDFEILKLNLKNLKNFSGLRNESGPKWVGAQMSWGPNVLGPKWVRGPNEEWAQMCPSQNCHIHDKILYCLITYRNFMKSHEKKTALRLASLAGAATSQADGSPWAC